MSKHYSLLPVVWFFLSLNVFVSGIANAELKPSQQRALDSRTQRLDSVAETLPNLTNRKAVERALRSVDKVLKDSQRYPADEPKVQALIAKAKRLRAQVASVLNEVAAAEAAEQRKQTAAASALADLVASDAYKQDLKRMDELTSLFQAGWSRLGLGHGQYVIRDNEGMHPFLNTLHNKNSLLDEANELVSRYTPYKRQREAREVMVKLPDLERHKERFATAYESFLNAFPKAQQDAEAQLNAALDNIIAKKNGYLFSDDTSALYKLKTRVEVQPIVYAATNGPHRQTLEASKQKTLSRFDEVKSEGHHHTD